MKLFYILTISLALFFNISGVAFSQDVTLSWDPSPTDGVTGYKVYYKQGDMNYPFDGTGADQGSSPVDVGDVLSTTLTDLPDGEVFYFSVTAYVDADQESSFSNIVSNSWLPALLLPSSGATNEPVPVTFQWETAPADYDVTYTLFYGTDKDEVTHATVMGTVYSPPGGQIPPTVIIIVAIAILGLLMTRLKKKSSYQPQLIALTSAFLIAGLLTACSGGGGGGGDSASSGEHSATTTTLYSINKGSSDYHQAYDLEGSTTYYWKVVATDTQDPNLTYESEVSQFTTEAF